MSFAIDTFDKEKFGKVTGSKCSVLFPLKGDGARGQRTYAKQLANQFFFKTYDERSTWQTEHGKMAEHFAFIHYQQYVDKNIEPGQWVSRGECGGTIDAHIPGLRVIDFKCPTSLENWLDYLYDGIDKSQEDQLQMYMYLMGYDEAEIAAYLTETQFMSDNGLTYPVPENQRMIRISVNRDPDWEDGLNAVLPGLLKQRDGFLEILKERFSPSI